MKSLLNNRVTLLIVAAVAAVLATLSLGVGQNAQQSLESGPASRARLVHIEPSDYAPVVVFEQYGERCMNFDEIEGAGRQTCVQLDDPYRMVFEYTRMMTSALLVKPEPESVLIIGLGGATLPMALHKLLPEAIIDSVELDPAVVRVAQEYFGYETGPRQRVFVEDGRQFVQRAHNEGRQYDIIMLDAFDADYIPAHLLTVEFFELLRDTLTPGGLVVANSFAQSRMYERESATYAEVFGDFYNLRAGLEGNRVIIAAKGDLPSLKTVQNNARRLAQRLRPFGIDAETAVARFVIMSGKAGEAEVLRDTL